jgi:hypothetical protein
LKPFFSHLNLTGISLFNLFILQQVGGLSRILYEQLASLPYYAVQFEERQYFLSEVLMDWGVL